MDELSQDFAEEVRRAWHRFLQRTEPCRPDLHRYCRSLTGSVWDAEDLVQDTLLRPFAKLGEFTNPAREVFRFEEVEGQIARLCFFGFCPETETEIWTLWGSRLPVWVMGFGRRSSTVCATKKSS